MRVLVLLSAAVSAAVLSRSEEDMLENPIRRIVNLLQKMQKEVTEEGERDKDLNEKFVCYCEKNDGELAASTEELRNKIPQIEASIQEAVSLKEQLDAELERHKADRAAAKESIGAATKQREKEAAEFASESGELKSNIAALKGATDAIAKGMSGSFLQSGAADRLRDIVSNRDSLTRYQRDTLTSFLTTSTGYAPASGEILGILRQLQEDMEKELKDVTEAENAAITEFEGLVSAKEKEIQAATEAIESKTQRAGETAVEIVSLKNDLEDTKEELGADEVFLMELKKSCKTKSAEYDSRKAARAQELVAISETIKILNDDDALDLFKKTLATPSFMQIAQRDRDLRNQALHALQKLQKTPQLNFIALALHGKKAGFGKVIEMIDKLVATLVKEQVDDDKHKEFCGAEFDSSEDDEKDLKRRLSGLDTKISETENGISTLVEDLEALKQSIKELDRAVDDATTQRMDEHKEFVQTASGNNAALQLLEVARNRLNKFYNPTLYKAPERRDLTEEERIYVNAGGADPRDAEEAVPQGGIAGTGVEVFAQLRQRSRRDAPPPPPETVDAYTKKDSSGPTALIDKLKNDLEKDVLSNEHDEQDSQKEYEKFMSDSVAARTADSKSITEKEGQKAELEADLMGAKDLKVTKSKELVATQEYIHQLHGSCDFLVQNYDLRQKARADETDALKNAKAVLSGADYSFRQVAARRAFLAHN